MLDGFTLIESELRQIVRDLGVVRRRLAANADMLAVALGTKDRELEHFQHAGVAFVEIEGHDL